MTRTIDLAVIAGDGIGPEVVAEGLKVLQAALAPEDVTVNTTEYDLGAARWHRTGETLPDDELAALRRHDAILLGAVGDPGVPSGVPERGLPLRGAGARGGPGGGRADGGGRLEAQPEEQAEVGADARGARRHEGTREGGRGA